MTTKITKPNSVLDYEAVLITIETYVASMKKGNIEEAKKVFHNDAVMYGFIGQDLLGGSINNLYSYIEQAGTASEINSHIDILHMTSEIAIARVELENDGAGNNFTDYHSLIKIDGNWQIVAKLFHLNV